MNEELFNEYMKYVTGVDLSNKNNIIVKKNYDGTSDNATGTVASRPGYTKFGQQGTTSVNNYKYTSPNNNGWYYYDSFNSAVDKDIEIIEEEAFFKINDSITKKDIIGWEVICVKDLDFPTSNFRQCFTTMPEAWVSKFDLYVEVISQELCVYVSPDYDRYIAEDEELIEAVEKILRGERKYSKLDNDELDKLLDEINKLTFVDNGYVGDKGWWHGSSGSIWNTAYDIDTLTSIDNSGDNITTATSSTGK